MFVVLDRAATAQWRAHFWEPTVLYNFALSWVSLDQMRRIRHRKMIACANLRGENRYEETTQNQVYSQSDGGACGDSGSTATRCRQCRC